MSFFLHFLLTKFNLEIWWLIGLLFCLQLCTLFDTKAHEESLISTLNFLCPNQSTFYFWNQMIDFEYIVLIKGSVHMSVLLYVHQKREAICALLLPVTGQSSTPLSIILLSIPYVLPRTLFVTSRPSCLAWKGEEHQIQKPRTLLLSFFMINSIQV